MAFTAHFEKEVLFHTSSVLECDEIVHAFSTRVGGVSRGHFASLNLRISCGDEEQRLTENYRCFCAALGTQAERCVLSKQVHEDTVRVVSAGDAGKGLFAPRDYTADALVTNEPGLNLMVFSADCGIFL
ncbi:MAG: laccase domain-containing protein, partial [Oscillospiraceae bacterium]|nr:laccase domain-containing protein [Oscillospiraceae bacterium]